MRTTQRMIEYELLGYECLIHIAFFYDFGALGIAPIHVIMRLVLGNELYFKYNIKYIWSRREQAVKPLY